MNIIIPNDVKTILNILESNGYEAFVVGGCVRDSILGREPKDWDITTSALPAQIKEIFGKEDKFKVLSIGERFGMIAVILNGTQYEITTYRVDGDYSDDRHPERVHFVSNIEADLSRRDFTMNAIAYNDKTGIVDPFGGVDDINNRIIQCVGNEKRRFGEDRLRILRAVRFEAQLSEYNMELSENIVYYLKNMPEDVLTRVSNERISQEINKILMSANMGAYVFRKYPEVFSQVNIFPFINKMNGFAQNSKWHAFDVYEHTLHAMQNIGMIRSKLASFSLSQDFVNICDNDLILRLALFFHDVGKINACVKDNEGYCHFKGHPDISAEYAEKYLTYLRYSNIIRETVVELVSIHEQDIKDTNVGWRRLLNKYGKEQTIRLFILRLLDKSAQNLQYNYTENQIKLSYRLLCQELDDFQQFKVTDLAIGGRELIKLDFKPGPQFKKIFNELLEQVIGENIKNEKTDLMFYVETHFK